MTRTGSDGTPHYSLYSRRRGIEPFRNPGPGNFQAYLNVRLVQLIFLILLVFSNAICFQNLFILLFCSKISAFMLSHV